MAYFMPRLILAFSLVSFLGPLNLNKLQVHSCLIQGSKDISLKYVLLIRHFRNVSDYNSKKSQIDVFFPRNVWPEKIASFSFFSANLVTHSDFVRLDCKIIKEQLLKREINAYKTLCCCLEVHCHIRFSYVLTVMRLSLRSIM